MKVGMFLAPFEQTLYSEISLPPHTLGVMTSYLRSKERGGDGALECWNVFLKFNSTYLLLFRPFSCSSVKVSKGTETQITKNTYLAYFFIF